MLGGLIAVSAVSLAHAACPAGVSSALTVSNPGICVMLDTAIPPAQQALLREWIDRSAGIVAEYYGAFPARRLVIQLGAMEGRGVGGGRTTNDSGLMIQVRVGREATSQSLSQDWVMVHEMVHLALPEVGRTHDWLAEGLATYVEGVARAQAGNREVADVWAEDRHSMPMGLPHGDPGGMDQRLSWGRTYWGGALYCLEVDVAIREQTANRLGLQDALRAIMKETGGYGFERDIGDVLRIGDAATGTHAMYGLYKKIRATPQTPDLDALFARLGVPRDPATQPFDDRAPLAAIRIAITAPRPLSAPKN